MPSGVRAWMWIIDAPSSTARRASAAYSSGVYGIAGHWSRLATTPEIEQVMMTGSSRLIAPSEGTIPWQMRCISVLRNFLVMMISLMPHRATWHDNMPNT